MHDKLKQYLMAAGVFALVALSIAALLYAYSYARAIEPSTFRSFSVSAEGKAVAVPDVANITFSVITQNGDLAKLQQENTERVNSAIEFVKSKGVDAKDIKTQSYTIEPRYQYYSCRIGPCPPPTIVGYSVTQTATVKIRDFKIIGEILAGVVERGANSVSGPFFAVDDQTALQNRARKEAIEKAKTRAREIAEAGGFRLGKLLSVDEGIHPLPLVYGYENLGRGGAAPEGAPTPTIEPGSQEVTVTVTLRYAIR